jgi:uncharacterized surface protein with fasciclin (FAS1) repeats
MSITRSSTCRTHQPKLQCERCSTLYCSQQCQKIDWPLHRDYCNQQVGGEYFGFDFDETIGDLVQRSNTLNILRTALRKADMLKGFETNKRRLTLFAPVDQAWKKLPEGVLRELMEDPEKLSAVLQGHLVSQAVEPELLFTGRVRAVDNSYLTIEPGKSEAIVNGARVLKLKRVADGMVYLIDSVFKTQ